jgi:hypothetical protein
VRRGRCPMRSIIWQLAGAAVVLVGLGIAALLLRDERLADDSVALNEAAEPAAEMAELRAEVARLRKTVAARHAQEMPVRATIADSSVEKPQADDALEVRSREAEAEAEAEAEEHSPEEFQASIAAERTRVETRFSTLKSAFHRQVRDPRWAGEREQELLTLNRESDYFRNSRFDEVECRSSWCRLVVTHPNESEQNTFQETLPGFVPQLPWASIRGIDAASPPRTEVFFSRDGPLPR